MKESEINTSKLGPMHEVLLKDGRKAIAARKDGKYHLCNINGSWQPMLSSKIARTIKHGVPWPKESDDDEQQTVS